MSFLARMHRGVAVALAIRYAARTSGTSLPASASNSALYISTDLVTWTPTTVTTTFAQNRSSVAQGPTKLIAIEGPTTGRVWHSADGFTWTMAGSMPAGNATSLAPTVAWDGTRFVALYRNTAGTNARSAYSPDGATWTQLTASDITNLTTNFVGAGLIYSVVAGLYIVGTGAFTADPYTSPDMITWTRRTTGSSGVNKAFAESGSVIVMIKGSTTNGIWSSANGTSWTQRYTNGAADNINDVIYANGLFVAVGSNSGGTAGRVFTSPDGITWTSQTNPATSVLLSVRWSGNQFVAGGNSRSVMTSPDGVTWTNQALVGTGSVNVYGIDPIF
jgi:hypothetical protein